MLSTAFWTSRRTVPESAKVATSTSMRPRSSVAVATTRSTPGRPITLSSTRRLMSCSTSWAEEPGAPTVTRIARRSMSG